MKATALCLGLLFPAAAFACPQTGDLAKGIIVTETGDGVDTWTAGAGNTTIQTGVFSDGYGYRNIFLHGAYVRRLVNLDNGVVEFWSVSDRNYAETPPVPAPSTSWTGPTEVMSVTETYSETQTAEWGALTSLQIGDCTVSAIQGTLTYVSADDTIKETVAYLPDLGISLLLEYQTNDAPPDVYRYTSIAAAD